MKIAMILALGLSTATVTFAASKKNQSTMGDLLKKVSKKDRGAEVKQVNKVSEALPGYQNLLQNNEQKNLSTVKPPKNLTQDLLESKNKKLNAYENELDSQINELYALTKKFKNDDRRGSLWIRLAELYIEKANIVSDHQQDLYDANLKKFQKGLLKTEPKIDDELTKSYHLKAIQLYEWFVRDFPKDDKADEALYYLGYENFELGKVEVGAQYLTLLTKQFPQSSFALDAHFALGELHFDNEKWSLAYDEYRQILAHQESSLYKIALYKSAWSLYGMKRTYEAIESLDKIIKQGRGQVKQDQVQRKILSNLKLETESAKDVVIFLADTDDAQKAIQYLKSIEASTHTKDSIVRLAYLFQAKGSNENARICFKHEIAARPTSPESFEYQYQILNSYISLKDVVNYKSELENFVVGYNQKSAWYQTQNDRELLQSSDEKREQVLRGVILKEHQLAQNTRSERAQNAALSGYVLYLKEFPNSSTVGDMHFFYGEILYDVKNYTQATDEYEIVVQNFKNSGYYEKAVQNLIISAEKTLPSDADLQKNVENSVEPQPLSAEILRYIDIANRFLAGNPRSDRAAAIKFKVGRLYYLTNNFDKAEKEFKEIVKEHPKTSFSDYSANLLLDIYSLKKDYVGLEKMGSELLTDKSIVDTQLGKDIKNVVEKATFLKAQSLEAKGQTLESAQQFKEFYVQNPQSTLAPKALLNAAINFEKSSDRQSAIECHESLLAGDSLAAVDVKAQSKVILAKLYLDSLQFAQAGKLYTELYQVETADLAKKQSYLYNAALMNEIEGRFEDSASRYVQYSEGVENKSEKADLNFKLAEIYKRIGQKKSAISYYRKYISTANDKKKIVQSLYSAYELSGDESAVALKEVKSQIQKVFDKASATEKPAMATYLARLQLIEAHAMLAKLQAMKISDKSSEQKASVDRKLEAVNNLNTKLSQIIRYDSPDEIIESLFILGSANDDMADSLRTVPVPDGLDEETTKQYKAELNKIIEPFLQKADDSYKLAVERGKKLGVLNLNYHSSYVKLSQRYPEQYYFARESQVKKLSFVLSGKK